MTTSMEQLETQLLYFAYGSNMSSRRLLDRVPSARFMTTAQLPGHELRFHKVGRDGSAKCDAAETGRQEHRVIGVVFTIDVQQKPLLDRLEDLGRGYDQKTVSLLGSSGERLQAYTYTALQTDSDLQPFHWYKEHVLRGAQEYGLPDEYIRFLSAFASITDPDPKRHARELTIYR